MSTVAREDRIWILLEVESGCTPDRVVILPSGAVMTGLEMREWLDEQRERKETGR